MDQNVEDNNRAKSGSKSPPGTLQRKRTRLGPFGEKKIAEDEFMAAAIGDPEWLRQSLRSNKGVVNYDKNGLAPIHLSAIHGRLDCLKLLVDKIKVDVNLPSSTGWRPVHLAISNQTGKRSFQCLMFLLEKGADASVVNEDGITPMHQAASEGHVQCLKALIEAGAHLDAEDNRGQKPIDLAKLWGHRKCARILASETWHQKKSFLASELHQLDKLRMQQVLQEIEEEEGHKADQQFYGELAFSDWLHKHGMSKQTEDPASKKGKTHMGINKPGKKGQAIQSKEKLHKANSLQTKTTPQHPPVTHEASRSLSSKSESLPHTPLSRQTDDSTGGLYEKPLESKTDDEIQESLPINEGLIQSLPWNKSTKVPNPEHVSRLSDYYPRDEFTMMPKYPLKKNGQLVPLEENENISAKIDSSTELRMPQLPKETIEKALGKSQKKERPVVYKCRNIIDVQNRKHYAEEQLPRQEGGMHLSNDVTSQLFQMGLVPKSASSTAVSAVSSSSSLTSDPSYQHIELKGVLQLMRNMGKPTHFPNTKGEEYDLNLGQLAGI